jgi:hypothetical protein
MTSCLETTRNFFVFRYITVGSVAKELVVAALLKGHSHEKLIQYEKNPLVFVGFNNFSLANLYAEVHCAP